MFGGMSHKISILSKKIAGGGTDFIPNALNWRNITYDGGTDTSETAVQQITGIDMEISIRVDTTNNDDRDFFWFVEDTPSFPEAGGPYDVTSLYNSVDVLLVGNYATINSSGGVTFPVTNNKYITFVVAAPIGSSGETITIKNSSDNNTVLDTFTIS